MRIAIRLFRPGGGSSVPGRIAALIQPNLVNNSIKELPLPAVLVTGSAGKSTTTKLLVQILRSHGLRVFTNPSTSNIRQGFFSAILTAGDFKGKLDHDIAVLEADEGHGPALARSISPQLAVFTNLMSDQLDRFVDPEFVASKLREIASYSTQILINADDSNLIHLAELVDKPTQAIKSANHLRTADSYPKYAFFDGHARDIETVLATVTDFEEASFSVESDGESRDLRLIAPGVHMALNTTLAIAAAMQVLGPRFSWETVSQSLDSAEGVFARWEDVVLYGVKTRLVLVQNPGSFNLNLSLIREWPKRVFIGIGRDVHDPSWLWTVDVSKISHVDVLGGFNAYEAAALLVTHDIPISKIIAEIPEAVDRFLSLPTDPADERIMIITADAMRRVRRHLRLAK